MRFTIIMLDKAGFNTQHMKVFFYMAVVIPRHLIYQGVKPQVTGPCQKFSYYKPDDTEASQLKDQFSLVLMPSGFCI